MSSHIKGRGDGRASIIPNLLILMCLDVAKILKTRTRSAKCFLAEVGCLCYKRDEVEGEGAGNVL